MRAAVIGVAPKFAPDPRRRAMLGKVHVAKKELGLTDDDYRAIVFDVAGVISAAECSDAQLTALIERFKARGFQPKKAGGAVPRSRAPQPADHPMARKARALWISLHQLGAIANPSERALEAFAQRQLGCERLQWADQSLGYRLVEALKAMAERHGWAQEGADGSVLVLKRRLAIAILAKLKVAGDVPNDWDLDRAAWSLLGVRREPQHRPWELGELDVITRGLGEKLRSGVGRRA